MYHLLIPIYIYIVRRFTEYYFINVYVYLKKLFFIKICLFNFYNNNIYYKY